MFYKYLKETYPKYSELLDTLAVSFSSEAVNFGDYSDTFTNHIINADMLESITSDIASKADKNHIHTEYALKEHAHTEYVLKEHTHNYAASKHTHKVSDLTDYINDITQRLLFYTQVKNYGINLYGDAIIEASGSLKYNGTNVSLEGHTHTISDITDYEASVAYDDTEVRELIRGKADTNHTHSDYALKEHTHDYAASNHKHAITDITNLQTTINSKLNTSEYNKLNSVIKTYRIRHDWRTNNARKQIAYANIGYVKNNFALYKGFMAKFELNIAASNNNEETVFESSVVCIGHVMEYKCDFNTTIGISSCYQIIGDKNRKLGIGLIDINGDNTVYGIDVIAFGYGGYYRLNLNITCEMDTKNKAIFR